MMRSNLKYFFLLATMVAALAGLNGCGSGDSESASAGSSYVTLSVEGVPDVLYAGLESEITFKINNTGTEHLGPEVLRVTLPAEVEYIATEGDDAEYASKVTNTDGTTTVRITIEELDPNSTEDVRILITTDWSSNSAKEVDMTVEVVGDMISEGELKKVETFKVAKES